MTWCLCLTAHLTPVGRGREAQRTDERKTTLCSNGKKPIHACSSRHVIHACRHHTHLFNNQNAYGIPDRSQNFLFVTRSHLRVDQLLNTHSRGVVNCTGLHLCGDLGHALVDNGGSRLTVQRPHCCTHKRILHACTSTGHAGTCLTMTQGPQHFRERYV